MSFLEGVVDILGEGAEDGAGEASASASDIIDKIVIDGADGAAGDEAKIGEEAEAGIKEAKEEMKDVAEKLEKDVPGAAEEAAKLEKNWAETFKNVWENAKTLGKFVGVEMLKGALFYAGTKGCEAVFKALSPDGSDLRTKIAEAIVKEGKVLQDAQDTWSQWLAAHYDDRASYGTVSADGVDIQLFQILQNYIGTVGDQRDKLVPLVNKVQKSKTLDDLKALLTGEIAYAKAVVDLSKNIDSKMTLMTKAGLDSKLADVQAAYASLVVTST